MNIGQTYLIQSGNRTFFWNDRSPKQLHRLFRIRKKNGHLLIQDHTGAQPSVMTDQMLVPPSPHQIIEVLLSNGVIASIRVLPRALKTSIEKASRIQVDPIPSAIPLPEDQLIQKSMKAGGALLVMIGLFVAIQSITDPTVTPDEKLIPKKFAKLILSKPKERSSALSKSGAAVSRSFRSQSVKKNLRTILQGGLSRYSIMETGKSIRELGNRMSQQGNQAISSLGDHTNRAIGSLSTGGVRSGIGTSVQGQGTGQIEIGLNYKDASVEEGLTREEVAKVIHGHLNEIRYCYESAILHDPSLSGKVLVDFRIGVRGQVETAQSRENTMSTPTVSTCLLGKLRNWKFPSPRGQVQVAVSYPFLFKSVNR
jgi:hypothetical protein